MNSHSSAEIPAHRSSERNNEELKNCPFVHKKQETENFSCNKNPVNKWILFSEQLLVDVNDERKNSSDC